MDTLHYLTLIGLLQNYCCIVGLRNCCWFLIAVCHMFVVIIHVLEECRNDSWKQCCTEMGAL